MQLTVIRRWPQWCGLSTSLLQLLVTINAEMYSAGFQIREPNIKKHSFSNLFYKITWISQYQKGNTILGFHGAWDGGVLDDMQTIQTSHEIDNHTNTSSLNFYRPDASPMHNQQCQSTEGSNILMTHTQLFNSPLSGTTRVGRYQMKHSSTHTHQISFIKYQL